MRRHFTAMSTLDKEKQANKYQDIGQIRVYYRQGFWKHWNEHAYCHPEYKENNRFCVHKDLRIEIVQGYIYSLLYERPCRNHICF